MFDSIKNISLGAFISFIIKNLTTMTTVCAIIWFIGKPFVDGYIVQAVANQKFVTQNTLDSVAKTTQEAKEAIKDIQTTTKQLDDEFRKIKIRNDVVLDAIKRLEDQQVEINRNIISILRSPYQFNNPVPSNGFTPSPMMNQSPSNNVVIPSVNPPFLPEIRVNP